MLRLSNGVPALQEKRIETWMILEYAGVSICTHHFRRKCHDLLFKHPDLQLSIRNNIESSCLHHPIGN